MDKPDLHHHRRRCTIYFSAVWRLASFTGGYPLVHTLRTNGAVGLANGIRLAHPALPGYGRDQRFFGLRLDDRFIQILDDPCRGYRSLRLYRL